MGRHGLGQAALTKPDALGPSPKSASDVLAPGDMIYVEVLRKDVRVSRRCPMVSGALVALEPSDGAISRSWAVSISTRASTTASTQAQRQPGSAFKPFLYSAALERGFTPATLVNDAPIVMPGGGGQTATRSGVRRTLRASSTARLRCAKVSCARETSFRFACCAARVSALQRGTSRLSASGQPRCRRTSTLALGTGQTTAARHGARFRRVRQWRVPRDSVFRRASINDASGAVVFKASPPLACPECALHVAWRLRRRSTLSLPATPRMCPTPAAQPGVR